MTNKEFRIGSEVKNLILNTINSSKNEEQVKAIAKEIYTYMYNQEPARYRFELNAPCKHPFKKGTVHADLVDRTAHVVYEFKAATKNLDNCTMEFKMNFGPRVTNNALEECTFYTETTEFNAWNMCTSNGYVWRFYTTAGYNYSVDVRTAGNEEIYNFFDLLFGGTAASVVADRAYRMLVSTADQNEEQIETRKKLGAYWSKFGLDHFFNHFNACYGISVSAIRFTANLGDVETLWKMWKRVTTIHVVDPQAGGCTLLISAYAALRSLEEEIEYQLRNLGEYVDRNENVLMNHFHGYELDPEYYLAGLDAVKALSMSVYGDARHIMHIANGDSTCLKIMDLVHVMDPDATPDDVFLFMNPPYSDSTRDELGNHSRSTGTAENLAKFQKLYPNLPFTQIDQFFLYHALTEGITHGICYMQYTHVNDAFYQVIKSIGATFTQDSNVRYTGEELHNNWIDTAIVKFGAEADKILTYKTESKYTKTYPCFPAEWDDLYPEFESLYEGKKHKTSITDIFGEMLALPDWAKSVKVSADHPNAIPCVIPSYLQCGNTEKGLVYVDRDAYLLWKGKELKANADWWRGVHVAADRLIGKAPVSVPEGYVSTARNAFRNFPEVEGSAAYISRAFVIWCVCTATSTSGFVKDAQIVTFDRPDMAHLTLYSIKSFPLTVADVQNGILDRYATMTDREVFEDLWSRYKKLTGK